MDKYRFIQDVALADTCFEAYGQNLNLLFSNACLALEEVMVDTKSLRGNTAKKLALEAETLPDLLFKFLEELVYLKDGEQFLVKKAIVHIINAKPVRLTAELHGDMIDYTSQKLRTDVKAVTYHMFELKKLPEGWKARVVVDV